VGVGNSPRKERSSHGRTKRRLQTQHRKERHTSPKKEKKKEEARGGYRERGPFFLEAGKRSIRDGHQIERKGKVGPPS